MCNKVLMYFILLILILSQADVKAQSTNNNQSLDSTDLLTSLELLGMSIYKFPFNNSDTSSKPRLNFKIEISDSGQVIYSENFLKDLVRTVPKGLRAEDVGVNELCPIVDKGQQLIRVYVNHSIQSELQLSFVHKYSRITKTYSFDSEKYGTARSRAFNFTAELPITKEVPLLVFYANEKGKPVLNCPGRLTPKEIQKRYDYALIVYAVLDNSLLR